jgi:AraC family transcriptional regulator
MHSHVPITMGTQRFKSLDAGSFRITRAWFPPGSVLEKHTHDRAVLAVMLRGGFRTDIAHQSLACDAGYAWTEPLGEAHANHVGAEGAYVVVIQPDGRDVELLTPMASLFGEVALLRHARVVEYSRRIAAEVDACDALNRLCLEALSLLLVADAARLRSRDGNGNRMPAWLKGARDMLHDCWRDRIGVSEMAAAAGVHPVHFARMFRRYHGASVGTYARKQRLDWAARELENFERCISAIALEAGFSDQSHFTRECKRHLGYTPAEYRTRCGGASRDAVGA